MYLSDATDAVTRCVDETIDHLIEGGHFNGNVLMRNLMREGLTHREAHLVAWGHRSDGAAGKGRHGIMIPEHIRLAMVSLGNNIFADNKLAQLIFMCGTEFDLPQYVFIENGVLSITVRLILWERDGSRISITDIKEQEVPICDLQAHGNDPRLADYFAAVWEAARVKLNAPRLQHCMPQDFFIPLRKSPMHLKTCGYRTVNRSVEEFLTALMRPSRLGPDPRKED